MFFIFFASSIGLLIPFLCGNFSAGLQYMISTNLISIMGKAIRILDIMTIVIPKRTSNRAHPFLNQNKFSTKEDSLLNRRTQTTIACGHSLNQTRVNFTRDRRTTGMTAEECSSASTLWKVTSEISEVVIVIRQAMSTMSITEELSILLLCILPKLRMTEGSSPIISGCTTPKVDGMRIVGSFTIDLVLYRPTKV
jgi:hypothetical protein